MKFQKTVKKSLTKKLTLAVILNHAKKFIILLFFIHQATSLRGQYIMYEKPAFPKYNIGFGAGIDYGGIGTRATLMASERLEIFGAFGYNLLDVGFNCGVDIRLAPKSRVCPYLGAMYGYNAVIIVDGTDDDKTYYGPSFNLGFQFWSARRPSFFNVELIVPVRSEEYHNTMKDLKDNQGVVFETEPLPIAFSIGYHFVL